MALDGAMRIYRLRDPFALEDDSLTGKADGRLHPCSTFPPCRAAIMRKDSSASIGATREA